MGQGALFNQPPDPTPLGKDGMWSDVYPCQCCQRGIRSTTPLSTDPISLPPAPTSPPPPRRRQGWAKMALLVSFFIPARQRLVKGGKAEWQTGSAPNPTPPYPPQMYYSIYWIYSPLNFSEGGGWFKSEPAPPPLERGGYSVQPLSPFQSSDLFHMFLPSPSPGFSRMT